MVVPLHNNLTSDATVLHYSSTVLSKHCCYISKLRQWDLGYIRHIVPTQPIPCFYTHQHWCVEITTYRDWVLIKETPEDQYHTNIPLANSKTKTTQKVLRLPHTLSPSPHYTYMHTHVGYSCVSFLLWMCRLCGNYLIPNNLQSRTWPQLCMCSSSPLTECWDITFIWIGRPFVTNLAVELTFKALIQDLELQWNWILLHSLLHHMVHPLLYNYRVPKGYL